MKKNTGKRLTNEEALDKIFEKCKEKNVEFVGFKNEENVYKNNKTYLILKCNKCGNVWDTTCYNKFISANRSCPNCVKNKKITEEEAIEKITKVCKEKKYEFVGFAGGKYNNVNEKLILKCKKCGEIWNTTTFNNFIKNGRNSHSCGRKNPSSMPIILNEAVAVNNIKEKLKNTSLEFISFNENGYIGSKKSKILLKCKKCGKINEYSYRTCIENTLKCKECERGKFSDEFARNFIIEKCKTLDYEFIKFDNEKNKYDGKNTYLVLKCNKCGIIWKTTTFASFRKNIIKCPGCTNSWKMEKEIEGLLKKNSIEFVHQCRNRTLPWLTNKISLSLDFYLPKHNIAIECNGRQHFEPVLDFGGEKTFQESLYRDEKKLILCKSNGVKMLYYDSEHGHKEFLGEKVYNTPEEIIKEIN